ncbi:MAG: bifunctional pyr operon transcriptional regulator/uracil phosphoribosyltransferase PyrR [Flavobacteriia bacterium]|nr:bifunctional pyr operon transcriptional regulator/uracil phosphoribosyltransferase PyrR [Flavobacteriia bacterium]NBX38510.1 bifunctional pyr operon transcriptional regulator/uracil phosphoribosyltransferase PyrR [Flavobacteriia bacterium]
MEKQIILNAQQFDLTVTRLCHELLEQHMDFSDSVLIGLQPRGIHLVTRMLEKLKEILPHDPLCGSLDITFHRDDFRRREAPLIPSITNINFSIENKRIILVDDVLFTGRTIRSGLDALLAYGRPSQVQLLVLIDRRFKRDLPIQADYVGKSVDTLNHERVHVRWKHIDGMDNVELYLKQVHE